MIPRQDSDHPIDRIRFGLMVAIGGEDASETLELLEEQEKVARRELEEVPRRAEARGEEFLRHSQESREELLRQLGSYLSWILKARQALEQNDSAETMEAYEASQEILPQLNAALDTYSKIFAGFGPYQTAAVNTLSRMLEAVESGEVNGHAWREYCDFFAGQYGEKLAGFSSLELPGRTLFKNSCRAAVEQLKSLGAAAPASPAAATPELTSLDEKLKIAELFEMELVAAGSGPTTVPATNVMIDFLNGWAADGISTEALSSVVEDYADIMDQHAEQFEEAASKPADSALIQEEIPRTLDAMDSHYSVIEELLDALPDLDKEKAAEFINRLKETSSQLEESREVYATAAQHQHHIACPSCARSNPPENRNCEACGEILPRPEDSGAVTSSTFSVLSGPVLEEHQQLEMTENVARLFQACDDVNDGKITPAEFQAEIQRAALGLKEFVDELDGIAATALDESNFTPEQLEIWKSQHLPYLEDVAVTYSAGLKEVEEGLQSMEQYLSEPEEQHLVDGIRMVWQGLSAIHRGRLSMETYTSMLEDVIQEAQEEGLLTEG